MLKDRLVIIFALEHYNPLGLIRSLGENGISPVYFSIKRKYEVATKSKYISQLYRANSIEEGYEILMTNYGSYSFENRPFLLFSDDKCLDFFDARYDLIKEHFVCFNARENGRITKFMNKKTILDLAKESGFDVLESIVVRKGDIPDNINFPIITKDISPTSGSWKYDVFICNNISELKEAYSKITSKELLLQRFVDKKNEYALEGFSVNHGKQIMITNALTWKYQIKGYYSPYHDVAPFNNKEIEKKLHRMIEKIGFEGIFEAEFIIDKDDRMYFLEINFRASAWNHSSSVAGMPLSYLWVKCMYENKIDKKLKKDFEPFTDMSEAIDFGIRVDTGMVSLPQWLFEFKQAKSTYIYDEKDPEPFKALFDKWDDFK